MEEKTTKSKKIMDGKGKQFSLGTKAIAILFVFGAYFGKLIITKELPNQEEAVAIKTIALTLLMITLPVDASMVIKTFGKAMGKRGE